MKIREFIFGYNLLEIKFPLTKQERKESISGLLYSTIKMGRSIWDVGISVREASKVFNDVVAAMAAKGYFRGHPLIWINNQWVYQDNNAEIPANGGEIRPCSKCGALFPLGEGEVDPCLGVLSGVDNACCGHGIRSQAYVRFTNGVVLKEFIIETKIND